MKKIISILMLFILVCSFPLNVFATENTTVTNESVSSEEVLFGKVELQVDVTKNRLKDFKGYDFYVEIKRTDVESFDPMGDNYYIKSNNDYYATYDLPYGTYDVLSAGVPNDGTGRYSLSPSIESFTLSEENPKIKIDFVFNNIDYSTGKEFSENEVVNGEYINENNDVENPNIQEEQDNSQFVMLIGIFMVIIAVVIGFCIFFLASMKKYKNEN